MIVYKGFNTDMTCRGFQYKTNKSFSVEGNPEICVHGFHSCIMPIDVLKYYPDGICYKAEIDISNIDKSASALIVDDSKICSKTIYITDKKVDDIVGEQEMVLQKIYNYLMRNNYKGFDANMLVLCDKYAAYSSIGLPAFRRATASIVDKAWFVLKMAYSSFKKLMYFDNFFEFAEDVMNTEVRHEKA